MRLIAALPVSVLLTMAGTAAAAEAFVRIALPAPGARLDALEPAKIAYEVEPGPKGDHVHVYADDKEVGIVRQLKGTYTIGPLTPGPHALCIKVVNKAHVPIGVSQCVKVVVE